MPPTRRTTITLPAPLPAEPRTLGINAPQTSEPALTAEAATARRAAWLAENRAAIDAWNQRVEQHGLPLAQYRRF